MRLTRHVRNRSGHDTYGGFTIDTDSTTEDIAALRSAIGDRNGLPPELAELLTGDTAEEMQSHALRLAKFAPAERVVSIDQLSGGLDPTEEPGFDAVAAAQAYRSRRR